MAYRTILLERKEKNGIIEMNRAQQRNALNARLAKDIRSSNDKRLPGIFYAGGNLAEHVGAKKDIARQRETFGKIAVLW